MVPGAVFVVADHRVSMPHPIGVTRDIHPTRRVIIVSGHVLTRAVRPNTLLIVPCSASRGSVGPHDLLLPDDEAAFTSEKVVAVASLLGPILKSDLQSHVGDLRTETLERLQAVILANLGVVSFPMIAVPTPKS